MRKIDDNVYVFDHPLIQHKISIMRSKDTSTKIFRELVNEIAMLMCYEVTKDLPLETYDVETPIAKTTGYRISGKTLALVPILRAGLGMVDGIMSMVPTAKVGHVGLYRDPKTHEPVEYYCKLPDDIENRSVYVLDPMLATGGSAVAAISFLKQRNVKSIKFLCLVAADEGIRHLHTTYPDVTIYCAANDKALNENKYIVPGLGDAGDRIYGTK